MQTVFLIWSLESQKNRKKYSSIHSINRAIDEIGCPGFTFMSIYESVKEVNNLNHSQNHSQVSQTSEIPVKVIKEIKDLVVISRRIIKFTIPK